MRPLALAALVASSVLFGTPAAGADGWHAAFVDQSPWPKLAPGATASYTVRFRNSGTETWMRGVLGRQANLGINGDDRSQSALGVGWPTPDRPAIQAEAAVTPGAIATFTFSVRAPTTTGQYRLHLRPVIDGTTWMEDYGVFLVVDSDAGFHSQWVSQSAWPTVQPGQTSLPINLTFRNAGTRTWERGLAGAEARLGIAGDDPQWAPYAIAWPFPTRVAAQTEQTVAPGANATFTFQMRAPQTPGRYTISLRPVIDGVTWMEDQGVFVVVTVPGLPPSSGAGPTLATTVVQSGLTHPWDLAFAPDGRMFVTERVGNILIYASAAPGAAQLANVGVQGIRAEGEAGAMGIALDPDFATNHFVYVCASRTDNGWWNQVLRYRESNNALVLDGFVIRTGMYAGGNHDGCRIRFGPDRKLWVTMGEVGNTAFSQNPNSLNGKVLRINADGTIPDDNPVLPGAFARSAAFTMGHRNPQGIAFQPGTGLPFTSEHAHYTDRSTGAHSHATVNLLAAGSNFSWPQGAGAGFAKPAWQSLDNPFVATSGNAFVSGSQWGSWSGNLFLAALSGATLMRLEPQADSTFKTAQLLFTNTYGRLRAVVQAPDGTLYFTTSNGSDRIVRVTPTVP